MIIVHDTFVCKPGNASKLAKMFKTAMADSSELVNIMTDMTGQFNRVVMVTKYENLTAYEQSWEKYKQDTEAMKKMQESMTNKIDLTNHLEIYPEKFYRPTPRQTSLGCLEISDPEHCAPLRDQFHSLDSGA